MSKTVYHFLLFLLINTYGGDSVALPSECSEYDCGNGVKIKYPFWNKENATGNEYCGYPQFGLSCYNYEPVLSVDDEDFLVKGIDYTNFAITLVDKDVAGSQCPRARHNISLGNYPLDYTDLNLNISFYFNCTSNPFSSFSTTGISCLAFGNLQSYVIVVESDTEDVVWDGKCEANVVVTVMRSTDIVGNRLITEFGAAMNRGFVLDWMTAKECGECERNDGFCGYDTTGAEYVCYCQDGSISNRCKGNDPNLKPKVVIGLVGSFGTVSIMCILFYSYLRCKKNPHAPSAFVSQTKTNSDFFSKYHMEKGGSILEETTNNFEAFLEKHGPLGVKRYSYSQVKKMTNSFKEKLGQGGYGSVYKGMLLDGCHVAVKMLNVSKGEGEEFINEVAAISRTSHVNVVTLMGFCLEGHKRALVYEFMPNGSLDKFISHTTTLNIGQHLGWETIHQIAIGIAQGLEYLHRGCNTRIVHFDIKPHNVLLDENLTPKISDFGLAKLCTRRESIVSMSEARGTIGYIAPEVFSRNFGQVSSKSDVYSYGMMILEIVGGRKKDIQQVEGSDECSEMYFPNWIYKSLELETKNKENSIEEEGELIVRKLKLIGLWCIQTSPLDRPTMSQVIQMLQGSIQTLNIPPKPFLSSSSSPPRFAMYSSTTSTVRS